MSRVDRGRSAVRGTIDSVEIRVVHPPESGFRLGDLWIDQMMVLLTITTVDGASGTAGTSTYGSGRSVAAALVDTVAPVLLGSDPFDREAIGERLFRLSKLYLHPQAAAVADCALWDLAGRAAGLPVHRLLGTYRTRMPAYASLPTYPSIDEYIECIDVATAEGFRAVKLHVWGDAARDIELCTRVRERVGYEVALIVDAAGHYEVTDALRVGRALQELGYEWFEMPIEDPYLDAYAVMARELLIPITTGEVHRTSLQDAAVALRHDAWDIVRVDACNSGGVSGARKTAALAEAFGRRCEIHSWGFVVNQLANLQVAAAVPNCRYFEMPFPQGAFDFGFAGLRLDAEGCVSVPDLPGIGLAPDQRALDDATIHYQRVPA